MSKSNRLGRNPFEKGASKKTVTDTDTDTATDTFTASASVTETVSSCQPESPAEKMAYWLTVDLPAQLFVTGIKALAVAKSLSRHQ